MDQASAGALLREVARLHGQAQREQVACCGGTTSTQCTVLTELGRGGPMTLADLGRRLGVDKGWVSRVVEALVGEGLLVKAPGETDRRTVTISLSDEGLVRYTELNQSLNGQSSRVMNRIPAGEREGVYRALQLLEEALRAEAEGGPVPICFDEEGLL